MFGGNVNCVNAKNLMKNQGAPELQKEKYFMARPMYVYPCTSSIRKKKKVQRNFSGGFFP